MKDCAGCSQPFEPGSEKETLCDSCLIAAAGQEAAEGAREADAAAAGQAEAISSRRRWARAAQALLIAGAVGAVIMNLSVFQAALTEPKPVRWGTYDTDRDTDRCIMNLWKAFSTLRSGEKNALSCPLTGAAYIVVDGPGGKIVRCPNPDRHGLNDLRAGGERGVPEAVQ